MGLLDKRTVYALRNGIFYTGVGRKSSSWSARNPAVHYRGSNNAYKLSANSSTGRKNLFMAGATSRTGKTTRFKRI